MYVLNGNKISGAFTIGTGEKMLQYPANWIILATPEERAIVGIIEVADHLRPDDRFYTVTENEDGSFQASPKPRDQTTALVWELIKAERDRRIQSGGYKIGAWWFHSDTFSRTQQMSLIMLGEDIPANTQWKTMDGTNVTMTQALAGQVFATAAASDIAIFAAAETHKAAMEASDDPACYDFSSGWPEAFFG